MSTNGAGSLTTRPLGKAGFDVTELSLGGAGLGGLYREVSDEDGVATICRAVELGVNYFETSPFYGQAEDRMRLALRELGGPPPGMRICIKAGTHPDRFADYTAEAIRWSVEASLDLIGLERADLVQVHALDDIDMDLVLSSGNALDELERLRDEGRVGAIALGVRGKDFHTRAVASGRFDAILTHDDYSLLRISDMDLVDAAYAARVGVLMGRALMMGLLVGHDPMADERLAALPDATAAREWWLWAREQELPLLALALQFPLRHPGISSVVVGASNQREIEENVAAYQHTIPEHVWDLVERRVLAAEA